MSTRWNSATEGSKVLGDCVSCERPALSYTGATTTDEGKYLCGPCSTRLRESFKLKKKPAATRGRPSRREFPEPAPVSGARWLQLGDRRLALVDNVDFERVNVKSWFLLGGHAVRRETWGGAVRHDYLHRFVLGLEPGQPDEVIEFIDGNPLNCRRSNLRHSARETQRNSKKS